jgi:hypothetical protein
MAKASPTEDKGIDRRVVLKAGAALAAAGPALVRGGHAEAQANPAPALRAYVGAFTTPERKGREVDFLAESGGNRVTVTRQHHSVSRQRPSGGLSHRLPVAIQTSGNAGSGWVWAAFSG